MDERTEPACLVLSLARQFEELALQLDDADKPGGIGSVIGLGAKMDEIAEAASYLSPKTLAGAAFQVMLASAEVDTIENGTDASQLKASKLMIQRLIYRSVEMMQAELAEFPWSKSYMMSDRFDPRVDRTD
jgi:hypothetical protein